MQALLNAISALFGASQEPVHHDPTKLHPDFVRHAEEFYSDAEDLWEPVVLRNGKTYYLLRDDPRRDEVSERMMYLDKVFQKVWTRLLEDPLTQTTRKTERENIRRCLAPKDVGISHIVQKPLGGYDVRAYAHDSWIFVELPTFKSVETGDDGINTTEDRRRRTLAHIVIHEVAHVAGYWEHDDKHAKCIAWLTKYLDFS